jgi:hypothetical protein
VKRSVVRSAEAGLAAKIPRIPTANAHFIAICLAPDYQPVDLMVNEMV